jgi:dTDP-4-amino-4,6-dideoxygalactose transaminase
VTVPPECDPGHVYHLFVVRCENRDALQFHLSQRGIETLVHYPIPIPNQPAFSLSSVSRPAEAGRHQNSSNGHQQSPDYPVAGRACNELLSLPLPSPSAGGNVQSVIDAIGAFSGPVLMPR